MCACMTIITTMYFIIIIIIQVLDTDTLDSETFLFIDNAIGAAQCKLTAMMLLNKDNPILGQFCWKQRQLSHQEIAVWPMGCKFSARYYIPQHNFAVCRLSRMATSGS